MKKTSSAAMPLRGKVALVAGATRGAGRGIARALGEAGATVYCTGRSVKGKPSPYGRPETIDETAAMIKAAGGKAIAAASITRTRREVKALFRRILRAHKRIDVVVDSVAGEDPLMGTLRLPLAGGSQDRRRHLPAGPHVAHHHGEACRAGDDARQARPDRRSDRERHDRRRRQSNGAGRQDWRRRCCRCSGPPSSRRTALRAWPSRPVSSARNRCCSTSASRKTTGATPARRIPTSCSRNRRCSSDARSPRWRRIRRCRQRTGMLFGSWELGTRLRLGRLRRPSSRLGPPRDRFLGAAGSVDRSVPHRHRPGDQMADDARGRAKKFGERFRLHETTIRYSTRSTRT